MELDPNLAEAHNVLASRYTNIDLDWDSAEEEYLKAIELNPNYATAYHYYSEHLSIVGRHTEAREQIEKAVELDPLSFIIRFVNQKLYFHRGFFKEALAENQRCHELNDGHPWLNENDFDINFHLKNEEATSNALKEIGQHFCLFTPGQVDSAYEAAGFEGMLRLDLKYTPWPFRRAMVYGYLGENELAMDLREELFNNNEAGAGFVFNYAFRNLHSDPRFQAILRRMNLPTH